jgi:hypothetical protein
MRSLKDKVIEIVIVAPCERMTKQNARKRKEFLYRLKGEANVRWSGLLPRIRAKTDDVFDLILSADISIQQRSPFLQSCLSSCEGLSTPMPWAGKSSKLSFVTTTTTILHLK